MQLGCFDFLNERQILTIENDQQSRLVSNAQEKCILLLHLLLNGRLAINVSMIQ